MSSVSPRVNGYENDARTGNSTADEVMASTEPGDDSESALSDAQAEAPEPSEGEDAGGLFGSGSEGEGDAGSSSGRKRKLDDEDLDSGDDEGRNDRMEDEGPDGYDAEEAGEQQTVTAAAVEFGRHPLPKSSDSETHLLKFPPYLGIYPKKFTFDDFVVPTTDHHSTGKSSTFSAAQVAKNTLRWRLSPNGKDIQSNSRIIKWSDGSYTLQLASNPMEQFELASKPMIPSKKEAYDARKDTHHYLASVHHQTSFAQITNRITNQFTVQTTGEQNDVELQRLEQSLAEAAKGKKNNTDGVAIISINEDPEQAKKRAELAEREKLRAQRRRQNAEERERDRANRVLGRSGLRTGGIGGGLTVGALEDDDGITSSRPRAKQTTKQRKRRGSEYSDDGDDFRNRGRTREDEYDKDDGFVVASDEEAELREDESDEEEDLDNVEEDRSKLKKTDRKKDEGDGAGGRAKRRRILTDEDDEG